MKKRILALALAGTTAFSVFGAAVTADAASSHVVYGNDPYTSYQAATVTFADTDNYTAYNPYTNQTIEKTADEYIALPYENMDDLVAQSAENGNAIWDAAQNALGYVWKNNDNEVIYKHSLTYTNTQIPYEVFYSTIATPVTGTGFTDDVKATTIGQYKADVNTEHAYTNDNDVYTNNGLIYSYEEIKGKVRDKLNELHFAEIQSNFTQNTNGTVSVNTRYQYKYSYAYGDGELVTDALSREGVTVENGNVYAYDYFTTQNGVMQFEEAWDDAAFRKVYTGNIYTGLVSNADARALITILGNISTDNNTLDQNDAVLGLGGYYDARVDVIQEYEDFLVELGLMRYTWNGTLAATNIDEKDFLSAYSYKYNGNDEYNFEGLVSDLFDSVGTANYGQLSSSHLVYLMQQYDKYVDGSYIGEDELDESEWANLLMECLNAVTADDFTTASAYNSYQRIADRAISVYELASTPAQQKQAIEVLYAAVVTSSYGRATTSDKTELANSLNDLYFNNSKIPSVYLPEREYNSTNADLTLYTYDGITLATATSQDVRTSIKAIYPLYPAADYYEKDREGQEYAGITAGTVADNVTAEYEWFANVYQLATAIYNRNTSSSYQGMIDTVNAALNEAVAGLAVTTTPAGSTTLRLEEAVDNYAGKIESDYIEKYYDAYVDATEYAEIVEGNNQTKYAVEIMETTGKALSYQGTQTTVTKGMISDLKTAIKNGETALKALKADEDKYNAAQVNALNKAIATAEDLVDDYDGNSTTKVNGVSTKTAGDKDNFVISDIDNAIEAIDAAINYSEIIMGWSKNDAGKWQYGTEEGYLSNGWNKIGKTWFYFNADGTAKQSEWFQENGTWYWFNSNCGAACGWAKVDGEWYYFKGNNAMKTGWEKVDGNWYYMASSGKMVTGWCEVNGKWYYFSKASNSLGQMLYSTTVDGYKLGADGAWIK